MNAHRHVCLLALVLLIAPPARADEKSAKPFPGGGFFALCVGNHDAKKRSVPDQLRLIAEMGFDSVGYPIWLGAEMDANLKLLDELKLRPAVLWTRVDVNPKAKLACDGRLKDALARLKGRGAILCVLMQGLNPGDPAGLDHGAALLRELGDLAAANDAKVSIYHHMSDWTQNLSFALEVVRKADRPNVGVNFNLCHWLMADGDKDYRAFLRANIGRVFVVTLNGAKLGSKTWTNGLIQPLDCGDFDNLELLRLLKELNYRGPVGLMCYGVGGDAREHLVRSMKVWKEWMGKL